MIATLRGIVTENLHGVVLECAGVGYGVSVSSSDADSLQLGKEIKLYIYEHIKEDVHDLYGFVNFETKSLFEQLLSVKNVGPKVALAILDIGSSDTVRAAIANGEVKYLQSAKGVGKRAAEQIVVELRDKMGAPVGEAAEGLVARAGVRQHDEAWQALVALGFTEADAQMALDKIDITLPTEERIRRALKK